MSDQRKTNLAIEAVKVETRGEARLVQIVAHLDGNRDAVLADGTIVVLHRVDGVGDVWRRREFAEL